jgi:hypothetical protein
MSAEQNKELVTKTWRAFITGDLDRPSPVCQTRSAG